MVQAVTLEISSNRFHKTICNRRDHPHAGRIHFYFSWPHGVPSAHWIFDYPGDSNDFGVQRLCSASTDNNPLPALQPRAGDGVINHSALFVLSLPPCADGESAHLG